MTSAFIVGTWDTKGAELEYIRDLVVATGLTAIRVDLSTVGRESAAEIQPAEVAAHHPKGAAAVLGCTDRGDAVREMSVAFEHFVTSRNDIGGIIAAGGTGNTALVAPAFRALPVGLPKVLVSTVASGNVAPYVGPADISMVYSVADVQGLNAITRRVLGNAAHSLAGMMTHPVPEVSTELPAIGLTMFGVTTTCVGEVARQLSATHECLVFHATGVGGRSMEKLVDSGFLTGVLDLTTTEVADMLVGGVFAATEDRLSAIARTGIPYVGSCGALDMVNFGAPETIPAAFKGRLMHVHNPQVTLMRTTPEENRAFGHWIAAKLNACEGQVRFLLPEGGVSAIDVPGQPFHDPEADAALFNAIEETLVQTDRRRLIRLPHAINDKAFADAAVAQFRAITQEVK
ncbi:MAG: Tm-1-like ATP-binding domain-containing protein [Pararhodobacter sp.]|nr:Tm-1-like ATP-binding domain-containing protein [Pararhodobacter sp.]